MAGKERNGYYVQLFKLTGKKTLRGRELKSIEIESCSKSTKRCIFKHFFFTDVVVVCYALKAIEYAN